MAEASKTGWKTKLSHLLDMDVADVASLPAIKRHAAHSLRFCHRVGGRFWHDQCLAHAASLAYAALLAVVPLAALVLSIFTTFQAFDTVADKISGFLLQYLVPTSQNVLQTYISDLAGKAAALSIFGIIGLLITAFALLYTAEETFNLIWRIHRARPLLSRFTAFWATLTLAPVLIGVSITITSYFTALPFIKDVAVGATALAKAPFLIPWLMSSLALTTLYVALPNTRVPLRHALAGGMMAGVLFELTKYGFAYYVTELAYYERLYGALGTLPVFLLWMYLAWTIVLLGAEAVYCLQNPEPSSEAAMAEPKSGAQLFYNYLILVRAAQAHAHGSTLTMAALAKESGLPDMLLQRWLDVLCDKGLLRQVSTGGKEAWLPGQEAENQLLLSIHQALSPGALHIPEDWRHTSIGRMLAGMYYRLERDQQRILSSVTMLELMQAQDEDEV